jgi:hypothetical protein
MKNCLISGFGRSGTSLMGGMLHRAGYYLGDNLYPPRHSNPKGFFEDKDINRINEEILSPYDGLIKADNNHDFKLYSPYKPRFGHRWLSFIPFDTQIECNVSAVLSDIIIYTQKQPFAYKDPRFCFTFDVWREYLRPGTVIIIMIRNPYYTVQSVLDECASVKYLEEFAISRQLAINLWVNYYRRVQHIVNQGSEHDFLLVDYDQLVAGIKIQLLADTLNVSLVNDFVDHTLNRSSKIRTEEHFAGCSTDEMVNLYHKLADG